MSTFDLPIQNLAHSFLSWKKQIPPARMAALTGRLGLVFVFYGFWDIFFMWAVSGFLLQSLITGYNEWGKGKNGRWVPNEQKSAPVTKPALLMWVVGGDTGDRWPTPLWVEWRMRLWFHLGSRCTPGQQRCSADRPPLHRTWTVSTVSCMKKSRKNTY